METKDVILCKTINNIDYEIHPKTCLNRVYSEDGTQTLDSIINELKESMEGLTYEKISITSFIVDPSVAEVGSNVENVTFSISLNKDFSILKSITINGIDVSSQIESGKITISRDMQTEWTLDVKDKLSSASKQVKLNFIDRIYYGASTEPSVYDSDFIKNLSNSRLSADISSITVNCTGIDKYIYFAVPSKLSPNGYNFTVNGFTGGIDKIATILFVNTYNIESSYDIYKSTNSNLGNTTINISKK